MSQGERTLPLRCDTDRMLSFGGNLCARTQADSVLLVPRATGTASSSSQDYFVNANIRRKEGSRPGHWLQRRKLTQVLMPRMKANNTKEGIKQAHGSGLAQSISLRAVQKISSDRFRGGDSSIWMRDWMTVHAASSQTTDGERMAAGRGAFNIFVLCSHTYCYILRVR